MPDVDMSQYEHLAKFDTTLVENMSILSSMDNYYQWISSVLRKYAGKRVLDIGCANGNLTQFFLDKEKIMGVDYSKDYLKQIKKRFKGRKKFASAFFDATDEKQARKLKKNRFDTIVTMNTFEHIKDDVKAMRNAYTILDKGGRFIMFVPAGMWLYSILDYEGGHYRRYTKQELANKLRSAGFVIEDISYMNVPGALGWYVNFVLFKKRIYSPMTFKLYNALVPLFRTIESIIHPPFGLSVVAVGRKK